MSLYDVLDDLLYHSSHTAGAHTRCALLPAACVQLFAEAFGRTLNDVSWLLYMAYIFGFPFLQLIGQNSWWGARFIISIVEFQAANILKVTAFCEIFIMPYAIVLTFM